MYLFIVNVDRFIPRINPVNYEQNLAHLVNTLSTLNYIYLFYNY